MITKEKLYTIGAVVLGLAAVYFFSKSFGTIILMLAAGGGGWYLKGKFGKQVEDTVNDTIGGLKK